MVTYNSIAYTFGNVVVMWGCLAGGKWRKRHARLPLYLEVQSQHSDLLHRIPAPALGWDDKQQAVRSFCRLRAGIIRLTHVDGRLSRASIQNCIFCSKRVRTGLSHLPRLVAAVGYSSASRRSGVCARRSEGDSGLPTFFQLFRLGSKVRQGHRRPSPLVLEW